MKPHIYFKNGRWNWTTYGVCKFENGTPYATVMAIFSEVDDFVKRKNRKLGLTH